MTPEEKEKILKFIISKKTGVKSFNLFAAPIWGVVGAEGFKVLCYKTGGGAKEQAGKLVANHLLSVVTSWFGSHTSGVGSVGSGMSSAGGKDIQGAFGADIGGIQLDEVMSNPLSTPEQKISAIIASGKLYAYGAVRFDKADEGYNLYERIANDVAFGEMGVTNIHNLDTYGGVSKYKINNNGQVFENDGSNQKLVGVYK